MASRSSKNRRAYKPRPSQLDDVDWLRQRYVAEGKTLEEIADELDCGLTTVHLALKRQGLAARRFDRPLQLDDPAWLRRRYWMEDQSCVSLGKELGCSTSVVNKAMKRHGIATRAKGKKTADGARRTAAARRRHTPTRKQLSVALKREIEGCCALCGTTDNIELHHVNAIRSDNRVTNLLPLCSDHHVMVEWFIKKATPGILACADETPAADFPPQLRLILDSRSTA